MYNTFSFKIHDNFYKFIIASIIVHILLITFLSIKWFTNYKRSTKAIDITIVHNKTSSEQKQFDFLAQANQEGGGAHHKTNAPSINKTSKFPDQLDKNLNKLQVNQTILKNIDKSINKKNNIITSKLADNAEDKKHDTVNNSEHAKNDNVDFYFQVETLPEISSLLKNIDIRRKLVAKKSRIKYLSASTKEFRDAEYLDNWRRKIEHFGNKYYPEQAKIQSLSGKVIVLVAINSNGNITKINIEKSSGHQLLDDAAIETLNLAAPFEPFTHDMQKDTDVLEIVRTWSFNDDGISKALNVS